MASQHPLDHGAISMVRPDLDIFALPDVVSALGYATLSAHAHHPQFWNARSRHRAYGFQTSLFDDDLGTAEKVWFGLTDRAFFERVAPAVEVLPPRSWGGSSR